MKIDNSFEQLHWLLEMVQIIDVGMAVIDRQFNIKLWNGFMENHSGLSAVKVQQKNIFQVFPELPEQWLTKKINTVVTLKNRAFINWEQRPHLFPFKNYRPMTSDATHMYQNIILLPLTSTTGQINHISIIVNDVTDIALIKVKHSHPAKS